MEKYFKKKWKQFINVIYKCAAVKIVSPLKYFGHWYRRVVIVPPQEGVDFSSMQFYFVGKS